jgi:hypothetical protein
MHHGGEGGRPDLEDAMPQRGDVRRPLVFADLQGKGLADETGFSNIWDSQGRER